MPDPAVTVLRRAAELLAAIPDPAAQSHAAALGRFLAEGPLGLTLEQATGIARSPGKRCHWNAERRERRDDALRAIYRQSFLHLGITQGAREMVPQLERYKRSGSRGARLSSVPKEVLDTAVEAGEIPQDRRMLDILRSE